MSLIKIIAREIAIHISRNVAGEMTSLLVSDNDGVAGEVVEVLGELAENVRICRIRVMSHLTILQLPAPAITHSLDYTLLRLHVPAAGHSCGYTFPQLDTPAATRSRS
jgi:hypothetical protein